MYKRSAEEILHEALSISPTVNNYLSMLEMIYQISLVTAYSSNISKCFIKSPKLFMTDSGLFAHLLDIHSAQELQNSPHKGDVVETFVYSELLKHISYSQIQPKLYHYRTNDKKEIVGIVFYAGETILSFGDEEHKRYAVPLSLFF